ncbi:hypothetical protein FA13DRAFT_1124509 [Coprinellus micaceus]|uniref:Uncharacterized protein n=1 Tax=Coprinellus micaceus TaxID=71717 RepID=A0A4Y7SVS4_COPMI|nr:hypothetical protein FA13DRAFT_1124509 [Coprinellus micaceus]
MGNVPFVAKRCVNHIASRLDRLAANGVPWSLTIAEQPNHNPIPLEETPPSIYGLPITMFLPARDALRCLGRLKIKVKAFCSTRFGDMTLPAVRSVVLASQESPSTTAEGPFYYPAQLPNCTQIALIRFLPPHP